ncbi:hypothetical protein JOF36_005510 [Pseudonocardia parietis]|uniref:Uncharacterized protein n=1 Tax=Pseudonocardia parietis TaxID=570936 RepID=A0ABS4W0W5_9PSEU|nr:hypothetical protein [Pseudonocardia parietis]
MPVGRIAEHCRVAGDRRRGSSSRAYFGWNRRAPSIRMTSPLM